MTTVTAPEVVGPAAPPLTATAPETHASEPGAALHRVFATGYAQTVDEHDRLLWECLHDQTLSGKRFRPALLNALYPALGGQDLECASRVAEAIELLHTAFVIHDDVIDGDEIRRGRLNVAGTFSARGRDAGSPPTRAKLYGDAAGILAGDLALAAAVREVALCGARPDRVVRLLDLLEEVLHRSAAGELADVRISLNADATFSEVLDVAEWKTAAYSFELPLQAAGILAGVDDDMVATLGSVGRHVGTAFQLCDDLNGVFGTVEETGKDPLGDLREGKCTALIAFARNNDVWAQLSRFVGDADLTPEGARTARRLLTECGARHNVEMLVADLRQLAVREACTLPEPVREVLLTMIERLVPARDLPGSAPVGVAPSGMQGAA